METLFVLDTLFDILFLDMVGVRKLLGNLPRVATLDRILEMVAEEHGVIDRLFNLTLRHSGRFRPGRRRAPLVGPREHDDLLCK
jgi:hypothetical protein